MKRSCILAVLICLFSLAGISEDKMPMDTTAPVVNNPATVDSPAKPTTTADTAGNTAAQPAQIKPDSSLIKTLEYQKAHAKDLYPKDAKKTVTFSFIIALALLGGVGMYLFWTTSLCRDLSYDPKTNILRPVKERPYSYSRVQMFWWTIIVLTCYVAFYFFSGNLVAITPTIVLLLGGGLVTSILGTTMDNNQIQQNNTPVPIRHQRVF
jgi:hypothetical protein